MVRLNHLSGILSNVLDGQRFSISDVII